MCTILEYTFQGIIKDDGLYLTESVIASVLEKVNVVPMEITTGGSRCEYLFIYGFSGIHEKVG
jgi:hypothetical protein